MKTQVEVEGLGGEGVKRNITKMEAMKGMTVEDRTQEE